MSQFPNNGPPPQGLNPAMLMQARPQQQPPQPGYAPQVPTLNPQAMMAAQNGVNPTAFAAVRPQVINPAAMSLPIAGAVAPGLNPTTMGAAPAIINPAALSVPPVQVAPPIPSPQPVATPTIPPVTPSAPPPPKPAPAPAPPPKQPAAPAPAPAPPAQPAPGQPAVPIQLLPMVAVFYAAQYHQILSQQAAVTPGTPVPLPYTQQQAVQLFLALTPTQQNQVKNNFIARQKLAQQAQQAQQLAQQAGAASQAAGQPPVTGAAQAQPPPAQPSATASAASTAPATPTPAPPKADKPKADKAAAKSAAAAAAASGSAATPPASKKNAPVRPRPPKEPKKARIDAPEKDKGKEKGKGKEKDKDKDKDKGKEPEAEKEKEKTKATKDKDADKGKDAQAVAEAARAAATTRDNTPDVEAYATTADPRRPRKEEGGFRNSMRGEIARLMYAAGDVLDPDADSVEYVEDLVVEFLSDLCRPVPPIRANVNAARLAVPLSADTVRHRLATHSHLRKYLERWDHMSYMSVELQQSKRVTQPSHMDLISSVGKEFLGLDGEPESGIGVKRRAAAADINGDGDVVKRRGRPPKNPEERKKPGPKKGWKKNLDPNALPKKRAPQGRPYKKKDRPHSLSVAPSPKKQP